MANMANGKAERAVGSAEAADNTAAWDNMTKVFAPNSIAAGDKVKKAVGSADAAMANGKAERAAGSAEAAMADTDNDSGPNANATMTDETKPNKANTVATTDGIKIETMAATRLPQILRRQKEMLLRGLLSLTLSRRRPMRTSRSEMWHVHTTTTAWSVGCLMDTLVEQPAYAKRPRRRCGSCRKQRQI
jgi:hypothetical protein